MNWAPKYEYAGRYRWDEARERIPNDYRTKDDERTEYPNAIGKEVWEDEKYADIENDILL